jgi:PIN domain nuclease of toxin-antitoxin system
MLAKAGRAQFHLPMEAWRQNLLAAGLEEIPLSGEIAILAGLLGGFDGDPADRMIVASAMRTGSTLLTADRRILEWSGELKREDAAK